MKYKTWQFSNLHNRYLLDLYAWTISIWKKPHNWELYWHSKTWFCVGMFEFMHHPQTKPAYAMKFIIRVYTPNDPFHARKTYFQGTTNGEWYLHIAFFGWEVMLGNTSIYISEMESLSQKINQYMPFFMWVDHE